MAPCQAAARRPPPALDLTSGQAGALLAQLRLAEHLGGTDGAAAAAAADQHAEALLDRARPGPVTGICWPSDLDPDGPGLCGLAHGASGIALALAEWGAARGRPEGLRAAAEAAAFEWSWFSGARGGWPDLREPDRLREGHASRPATWCHGATGIGVARLRLWTLTGDEVYAAEATAAIETALGAVTRPGGGPGPDLSPCHGVGGPVELLLDAAATFGRPVLREAAKDRLETALTAAGNGRWPCGVAGGGECPGLFQGMAGIAALALRCAEPSLASTVRAYSGETMSSRVIVQLSGAPGPDAARESIDRLAALAPDARVERVSARGRVLLRLPAEADVAAAVEALDAADGVEYAEADATDTVQ